ncbi:MAG: hypothetical protein ACP5HM_09540 [Anaerolineae bacterium]
MGIEQLKQLSEFLAQRKGLPVMVGVALVVMNLLFHLFPDWPVVLWLTQSDLFLHLGVVVGLLGVLVGDAL